MTACITRRADDGLPARGEKHAGSSCGEESEFECMTDGLTGPLVLALSQEDPGAAARVIKDFAKENDALKVTLVAIGGQMLDASQLDALAKLPTYDQAISMLMSVMEAPVQKLTRH